MLEKYPTLFFLQKPNRFNHSSGYFPILLAKHCRTKYNDISPWLVKWSMLAWGDLEPSYAYMNFFYVSRRIFIVHHEYAPQGQTITKEYYRDVLRRPCDAVRRERLELWSIVNWRLHQDNAPAHSSHLIKTFFLRKTRLLWFARLLTLPIWLPATSGCSRIKVGYFSNS